MVFGQERRRNCQYLEPYGESDFNTPWEDEYVDFDEQTFENRFLKLLLDDPTFDYSKKTEEEVDKLKIYKNTNYAMDNLYKRLGNKYAKYCVSRFISAAYIDPDLVYKYFPFNMWMSPFLDDDTYKEMLEMIFYRRNNIAKAFVLSYSNALF